MSAVKVLDLEVQSADGAVPHCADVKIGVAKALLPEDVIRAVQAKNINHVVQKDSLFFDTELLIAQKMTANPELFVTDPLKVIFDSAMLTEGPILASNDRTLMLNLKPTDKKAEVLAQFERFLASLEGVAAIRDSAFTVADELFTNGIKCAWPAGSNRKTSAPTLTGDVDFFSRSDGKRLVIGCRDSFGLLAFAPILSRIQNCYEMGVAQSISQSEGGAGIGSFMIFSNSVSYYAAVSPNNKTVVCVSLPLGMSSRKVSKLSKNIHLVTVK